MRRTLLISTLAALAVTGCKTTQPIEEVPIVIETPPLPSCFNVATLQRVEIPAETKVRYAITSIDNAPYEPIETRVKQTIVVKQAEVIYVNDAGSEVANICEEDIIRGPVGPAPGEMLPGEGDG